MHVGVSSAMTSKTDPFVGFSADPEPPPLREVPSGLPQVLWRVQLARAADLPGRPSVTWWELEGRAVDYLEDALAEGDGLASVYRLDLYPRGANAPDHFTWRELKYLPPARGRLVAKT